MRQISERYDTVVVVRAIQANTWLGCNARNLRSTVHLGHCFDMQ